MYEQQQRHHKHRVTNEMRRTFHGLRNGQQQFTIGKGRAQKSQPILYLLYTKREGKKQKE